MNNKKRLIERFAAVLIYSVAMGFLESAVVIYLRETTFGNSVQVFPMQLIAPQLARVEIIREAATIIMLLAIGYLAGKNIFQKWMFFVFSFAIWDVFYYFFLAILTGWPNSFGNFDVLFLIPIVWLSPVAAPILISLLLTTASTMLIYISENAEGVKIDLAKFGIFSLGAAIDFYSFTEQSFRIMISQGQKGLEGFSPVSFDWLSFWVGFIIMCLAAVKTVTDCYRELKVGAME